MFSVNLDKYEIYIYDEIGPSYWGLVDHDIVQSALDQMVGKHVTVRLNTPGGSVDEGIAIYNALLRHPGGVTTVVDSLAASMGSYIMQSGQKRIVSSNSMVMVHDPWTITMGNATQLRKDADTLDKYAMRMIPDYAQRSGMTESQVAAIMAEETWYTGKESVENGFADEVSEGAISRVEPSVSGLHRYCHKMPESLVRIRKDNQAALKAAASTAKRCITVEEAKMKASQLTI